VRKALILGVTGQDGQFVSDYLLKLNYEVLGVSRKKPSWLVNPLSLLRPLHKCVDVANYSALKLLVGGFLPDEIYNLSGESSVANSFANPIDTANSNVLGVLNLLNAIRDLGLVETTRVFQASTSEMFGPSELQLTETSSLSPKSPYGVSKYLAHQICSIYREQYGIWVSSGILFNHESELRPKDFVFQKIIQSLVDVSLGKREFVELGNINIERDWGYAGDYVVAMHKSLQTDRPRDYVIATGCLNSLSDLILRTCDILDINTDFHSIVRINPDLIRPTDVKRTWGNPKLSELELGWKSTTTFDEIINKMVNFNLSNRR